MLTTFINTLMSAEADAVCGAQFGQSSPDRTNVHNGYRHREFDTRAGTLDVAIPKLRSGSYFPDWLLQIIRTQQKSSPCRNAMLISVASARNASACPSPEYSQESLVTW